MGAHERALVLLLFSAASTGLIYVSSVYSQALKDTLDLSQDDIETISLSCYLGGLFGFLPGRVSAVMGARKTIVFGGGAQGLLLFVFWLVAKKLVVVPAPLPLLCVLTFLQYLSSGCTVAAVFSALSRLYGENRGVVVGMVAVPTPLADQDKQGAYRLVPWDSIAAETHVCPFDNS